MIRAGLVVILALALALGYALWGKSRADNRADRAQEAAERTAAQLRDTTAALETERGYTQRLHEIAAKHEKDKADAEAAAEQDRLRRASAARALRAAQLVQSERDEAVDRYQAIWRVSNEAP